MKKLTISAAIVLMCVSSFAQADGHSDAEAQIEKLLQDKKILATRLSNAIAFSKERAAQIETLQQQMSAEKSSSKAASSRLRNAIAFSKERAAQIGTLQQKIGAEQNSSKATSSRLQNAIAFSKERAAQIETLQQQIGAEKNNSKASSSRLRNAIAFSKERAAQIEILQQQLDSEKNKSNSLSKRLRNAIAFSKERAAQFESQQQQESDWAAAVSANLEAIVGGVQGTSVNARSDDSVNIQVGNNGLFSSAGIALSAQGSQLLSTIALELSSLSANVTVVGHTDNIPVGNSSRFSSNEELSFARAVSTLEFLRDQGIPTEQLSAAGYGAGNPVAGNDTAEGRAQNRRVEIVLRQ